MSREKIILFLLATGEKAPTEPIAMAARQDLLPDGVERVTRELARSGRARCKRRRVGSGTATSTMVFALPFF